MEIILKRNIGDIVWVMKGNKARTGKVVKIEYCRYLSSVDYSTVLGDEKYTVVLDDGETCIFVPKDMFDSKDSLIESL